MKEATPEQAPLVAANGGWPWWLYALLLLILLAAALAVWIVLRRRRNRDPSTRTSPEREVRERAREFLRVVPRKRRGNPVVLFMGPARSGKSAVIRRVVDWEQHAQAFFPSVTRAGVLQLYQGSQALAYELSSSLLYEEDRDTERALCWLFDRMGYGTTFVVLVISFDELMSGELTELLSALRAKLTVLTRRRRGGVKLRVCVTQMDQCSGFLEAVSALGPRAAERIRLRSGMSQPEVAAELSALGQDPGAALLRLDETGFRKALWFFERSVELASPLARIASAFSGGEARTFARVTVDGVCLMGQTPDVGIGSVLDDVRRHAASGRPDAVRHRIVQAAYTFLSLVIFGAILQTFYVKLLDGARERLERWSVALDRSQGTEAIQQQAATARSLEWLRSPWLWWPGWAYQDEVKALGSAFATRIRSVYWFPHLRQRTSRPAYVYGLSMTFASSENALGRRILGEPLVWATRLGVPPRVVTDYLTVSEPDWQGPVPRFDPVQPSAESDWLSYVGRWQAFLPEGTLDAEQLRQLQLDLPEDLLVDQLLQLLKQDARTASYVEQFRPSTSRQEPLGAPRIGSSFVHANQSELSAFASAVRSASLGTSMTKERIERMHLDELLTALAQLCTPGAPLEPNFALQSEQNGIDLDSASLGALLQRSRCLSVFESFRATHETARPEPWLFDAELASGSLPVPGRAGQGPERALGAVYTRDASQQLVTSVLQGLTEQLAGFALPDSQRERIGSYIEQTLSSYARNYRRALDAYYSSLRFSAANETLLQYALSEIVQAGSWYFEFLTQVGTAATPPDPAPHLDVLATELSKYAALAALLKESKGQLPGLGPYVKTVTELALALTPPDASSAASEPPGLSSALSPAGRIVLSVARGERDSDVLAVRTWLVQSGVSPDQHAPFLLPVQRAYALGRGNLERTLARLWTSELTPVLKPVAAYPFSGTRAGGVVSPDLAEKTIGPEGSFWSAFDTWLAPAFESSDKGWAPLRGISPDPKITTTLNQLERVRKRLWDGKGNRLPLELTVTPLVLPSRVDCPFEDSVVWAQLNLAGGRVAAFNQRPEPHPVSIQWWGRTTSSLEVRLGSPGRSPTLADPLEIMDEEWSFLRLLETAATEEGVYRWALVGTDPEQSECLVRFQLSQSPRSLLRWELL